MGLNANTSMRVAGTPDPERDPDLEWFLVAGSAAMRERGTMIAVVSSLELGGHPGGIPNTDLYSDEQLGWGKGRTIGDVERHRWLARTWFSLPERTRVILQACYAAPRAALRSDQGFGARDKWINDAQRGSGPNHRSPAIAMLGEFTALAFLLAEDPQELAAAIQSGRKRSARLVAKAEKEARQAAKEAHREWSAAKRGRPRRNEERCVPLPRHKPNLPEAQE
jgi:hypothetical protein